VPTVILSLSLVALAGATDTVTIRMPAIEPVACERTDESVEACTLTALKLISEDQRPTVDGRLDDEAWLRAVPAADFSQFAPNPGMAGSERTEARILYDVDAIYIGMRMYDRSPEEIRAQFVRRDDHEAVSDWAHVYLDSHYDRRTAFHFATTPTGTRVDILHIEDSKEDVAWDAVWDVETTIDSEGWTAEFRIPLSQLRFGTTDADMTWGVNFMRQIARRSESAHWAEIPPESGRLVSLFGDLDGLTGLEAPGRLEIVPYSVARLSREAVVDPDSPFEEENDVWGTMGIDVKYGLTSNLTLTATVNPDFGQVDADPSRVNLGTNENRYPEKRPFFLEGAEIFNFRMPPEGAALYSRRIGRPPQLRAPPPVDGFVANPDAARILGAMKLSGKTASGWSIGILNAVTNREEARVAGPDGSLTDSPVEPLTNYASARIGKDFREGRSGVSAISTLTVRSLDDAAFDLMHSSATAAGIDAWHRFGGSRYQLRGSILGSRVSGSEEAIARTQRSFVHLYQRPDADHLTYDPTLTSLSGMATEFAFAKIGGGHWTFHLTGWARTAGVETNDIGYVTYTDAALSTARIRYSEFSPSALFRNWYIDSDVTAASTLGWELVRRSLIVRTHWQFLNFWTADLNFTHWGDSVWPWTLRGGPALRREPNTTLSATIGGDTRKSWRATLKTTYKTESEDVGRTVTVEPSFEMRPSSRATVSLSPRVVWNRKLDQYVDGVTRIDNGLSEYVMGRIEQTTASMTLRLSYSFTSDLAFDLYAQPFMSSAQYSDFRRVADDESPDLNTRVPLIDPAFLTASGTRYDVDENGDASPDYRFRNRDFNVREMNTNAVLRWEYKPGSTLIAVWSSARNDYLLTGDMDVSGDLNRLFSAPTTNIFMLKFSYWVG
jgi:hypothetical protein